jgi:hypothetical protein
MKAKIFLLKQTQDPLYEKLKRLLRDTFKEIDVRDIRIDEGYNEHSHECHEHARDYLHLLRESAIPPVFDIKVTNDFRDQWCYMGDGRATTTNKLLSILQGQLKYIFPAVAVMGRMILVPQAMNTILQSNSDLRIQLKPCGSTGSPFANFDNDDEIRSMIQEAAKKLKLEVAQFCATQMLMRRLARPDFTDVVKQLEVSDAYLKHYEHDLISPLARSDLKILGAPVPAGRSSRVVLEMSNDSDVTLRGIRVEIRGPSSSMRAPATRHLDLSPHQKSLIEFEIKPATYPFCPLEISLAVDEVIEERREQADTGATRHTLPLPLITPIIVDVSLPT